MLLLPSVPYDVPLLIETSYSDKYGPAYYGIDIAAQWWCEATRRPDDRDAVASVYAPGSGLGLPLLNLVLPADDLDETEGAGHHAIRIARPLARFLNDGGDEEALQELKELLSPDGALGDHSSAGWHRLLHYWLPDARAAAHVDEIPTLELKGNTVPDELWTVSLVAKFLGYTGDAAAGSARKWLSRQGVQSEGREPGRRGESQYSARLVRAARDNSPGKGRRGAPRANGQFARSGEA